MVNRENYEEYLILYADGELDTLGVQELKDFISKNPELYDELAMYQQLRIVPDASVTYPGKDELLKKPANRIINLSAWQLYGATAAVLLLFCLVIYRYEQRPGEIKTAVLAPLTNADTVNSVANSESHMQTPVLATTENKHEHNLAIRINKKSTKNEIVAGRENNNQPVVITANTGIQQLSVAPIDPKPNVEPLSTVAIPVVTSSKNEKENTNLLAKLPLSPERTDMLNDVKNSFAGRIEQIQNLANNIKDTRLVIRIGQKQINF